MKHLKYRADIDGLRAAAILSIVGFHYFPGWIHGGFIGVDIFFVISGYLISSIIMENLDKDSFSYTEFYRRRIKRIFPALLFVISISWLFGWLVLFPDEFEQLGKHTVGGLVFLSNLILWSEAGYFDAASVTKPFLHLWSLGIEEQFYIVWPLLLGLVWKKKFNFMIIIFMVAAVSFYVDVTSNSDVSRFYSPLSRFWELMIGGILAYVYIYRRHMMLSHKLLVNIQSLMGTLMLGLSLYLLDKSKIFPGWWALLPTLGTFLIIASPEAWINRFVLKHRVLVYIGLISYPLYLWHWSLLSFANILDDTSREVRITLVILSFALACFTYAFIEQKNRIYGDFRSVPVLAWLSLMMVLLGGAAQAGVIPPRNHSHSAVIASLVAHELRYTDNLSPFKINGVDALIKHGSNETTLFFGDSHIQQYAPRIVRVIEQAPAHRKTAIFATRGGCPPIPHVYVEHHPQCNIKFKEAIISYAFSQAVDSIVIGFSSDYLLKVKRPGKYSKYYYLKGKNKIYFNEGGMDLALHSLESFMLELSRDKKVFLVIDNPTGKAFDPKRAFFSGSRLTGVGNIANQQYFQAYDNAQAEERTILMEIAHRSHAIIIDPILHFCVDSRCRTSLEDGSPVYVDAGHIRPSYVEKYTSYIDVTVRKE